MSLVKIDGVWFGLATEYIRDKVLPGFLKTLGNHCTAADRQYPGRRYKIEMDSGTYEVFSLAFDQSPFKPPEGQRYYYRGILVEKNAEMSSSTLGFHFVGILQEK